LNVFDNVSFPLVSGRRRFSHQQVHERTMPYVNLVYLEAFAYRPAALLSGCNYKGWPWPVPAPLIRSAALAILIRGQSEPGSMHMAAAYRVDIVWHGYDHDRRELSAIPEVRNFVYQLVVDS
jgi:hypothetical protein